MTVIYQNLKGEIMLKKVILKELKKELMSCSGLKDNDFILKGAFKSEEAEFYLNEVEKNLIAKMSNVHFEEYANGNGQEFVDKITPAKMKSLHSSSALTFNLLGNELAQIKPNNRGIDSGKYRVQYEKRFETLIGTTKANLDACLLSLDKSSVVFCEMKMFEWLSPKTASVSKSYQESHKYRNQEAFKVFSNLFKHYEQPDVPNRLSSYRYDAPQMLKHSLGIFNTLKSAKNNSDDFSSVKKVTLLNCVWKVSNITVLGDECQVYSKIVNEEHVGYQSFSTSYQPVIDLFKNELNIDLQLCYLTHEEFIDILDKTPAELEYLQRYFI
jgi:hypothetical protein